MSKRIIIIILGVLAAFAILSVGAAAGAALTYFALNARTSGALAAAPRQVETGTGLLVAAVAPGSPVEAAGLVRGDILLAVDGQELDSPADLMEILRDKQAGDEVKLDIQHGDDQRTLTATLADGSGPAKLGAQFCGTGWVSGAIRGGNGAAGAVITEVLPDSPAAEAGLQERDIILAVDGEEINPENPLGDVLSAHQPGDSLTLKIRGDGAEEREVQVTLGEDPEETGKAYLGVRYIIAPALPGGGALPFPPFRGQPFDHDFSLPLPDLPEGVDGAAVVREVIADSPAAGAGLQVGDLITAIDGEPVSGPEVLVEAIAGRQPGDSISLTVYRSGEENPLTLDATLGESAETAGKAYLGVSIGGFVKIERTEPDGSSGFDLPGILESLPDFGEETN